jgi:hypothetical protein
MISGDVDDPSVSRSPDLANRFSSSDNFSDKSAFLLYGASRRSLYSPNGAELAACDDLPTTPRTVGLKDETLHLQVPIPASKPKQ